MAAPTASRAAATPAILGGAPAVTLDQTEALRWPVITDDDERAVLDVLRSGALSIHDVVNELEDDYRKWLGVEHALAHCNGTSALHAAMQAFELEPGDEVIVPSATWWASVMPVVHAGCVPVFAETEDECLGLCAGDVESKITDRTRAIVIVHLFGMPSQLDVFDVARMHDLWILEDASHAHGASYENTPVGTMGHAAVFSMQANKLCPSAEGGMLVTSNLEVHQRAIRFGHYERLLGLVGSTDRRFAATGFGFKFRMSPLSAALARQQLRHLSERNRIRNDNCRYLSERLEPLGLRTFMAPPRVNRVYFEFIVRCDEDRVGVAPGDLVKALQAEAAQVTAPRYPLLHQQPVFTEGTWARIGRVPESCIRQYDPTDLPRTTAGCAALIRLPAFPHADRALLDQYATAFEKVIAHADALPREKT